MKNENEIEFNKEIYVKKSSLPKQTTLAKTKNKMPFVLIRSYSSGVHFGYLKSKKIANENYIVELENSRRIWKWDGACSLSQLALEGSKAPNNCNIAVELPIIEITGVIEIIPLSLDAEINLKGVVIWKK